MHIKGDRERIYSVPIYHSRQKSFTAENFNFLTNHLSVVGLNNNFFHFVLPYINYLSTHSIVS